MSEKFEKAKKGIACCERRGYCEGHCPYYEPEKEALECTSELAHDALALIRHLDERIKELEEGPKWISVKDRLPRVLAQTLLYTNDGRMHVGQYNDLVGSFMFANAHLAGRVTHWMPLPEPPKEEIK